MPALRIRQALQIEALSAGGEGFLLLLLLFVFFIGLQKKSLSKWKGSFVICMSIYTTTAFRNLK